MPHHPQRIALVGLSGAGKSSVGRLLAERLDWALLDVDALIETTAGRSIPQIFADEGEPGFRDREAEALRLALSLGERVIATGGGAVLRPENRRLLRDEALVVWLDAPTEVLIARLRAHDEERPLLAGDDPAGRLEALRAARAPIYAEAAHLRVGTAGLSHAQVVEEIIGRMRRQ
jgi:shikimate kinase